MATSSTKTYEICDRYSPNYIRVANPDNLANLVLVYSPPGMTPTEIEQPQRQQQDPDALVRLGGRLFRHRTWLPVPISLALLLIPSPPSSSLLLWTGGVIVGAGELLRLWAVRHIGVISRTRSDRLGPLISTGPFGWVRNPLYIGNLALWSGFTVTAGLVWLLPPIVLLLGIEYHAIVRWEEGLLEARLGETYRGYVTRVPRWIPRKSDGTDGHAPRVGGRTFSWAETLFSERGTLAAIGAGSLLLWLKHQL
jgi:protein-S-isoprenylcysteine O-methyltransferase Ste14